MKAADFLFVFFVSIKDFNLLQEIRVALPG